MITSTMRAGATAAAIVEHLTNERKAPPSFDDFDLEASSIMTIMSREGDSMRTLRKIAAELREFVRKQTGSAP